MSGIPRENLLKGQDITSLYPSRVSELINQYNCGSHKQNLIQKLLKDELDPEYWNRFTILKHPDCKKEYSKNYLLCLITDFVFPAQMLPIYVVQKGEKLFFVARNCLESIIKLCEAQLSLPNPLEPQYPFTVVIVKHFISIHSVPVVNVEKNIINVLKKRESLGLLDLSNFHEDKDLEEFCPLFQPKVLLYVLSLTTKVNKIFKIILCNNNIRKLPNFDSLDYKEFKGIDLGFNKIGKIEDILSLTHLPQLTWLRLEGNPLCHCFNNGHTYFLYVKTICKKLETLDTKRLCEDGWYKKHKTFLCSDKGFDFANQFLEKYYTHFDDQLRINIGSFYHDHAMFSMTHSSYKYNPLIPCTWFYPEQHKKLNYFLEQDGNLLKGKGNGSYLKIGRPVIEYMFQNSFPHIQHNPRTFFVDLMHYTKNLAIISVTGIFQDTPGQFLQGATACGFLRTFSLTSPDSKEWWITNDQWNIYGPLPSWFQNSLPSMPNKIETMCMFPEPDQSKSEELDALTRTFQSITEMTYKHSKRFLVKNYWNLELALKVFIDEHINEEIPDDEFEKQSDKDNSDSSDNDIIVIEDDILPPITKLLEDLKVTPTQEAVKTSEEEIINNAAQPKGRNIKRRKRRLNQNFTETST